MADEPEKKLEEAAEALKKAEEQAAKAAEDQVHPDASPVEAHERESIEDVREALAYLCEAEGERECDLWLADEAAEVAPKKPETGRASGAEVGAASGTAVQAAPEPVSVKDASPRGRRSGMRAFLYGRGRG